MLYISSFVIQLCNYLYIGFNRYSNIIYQKLYMLLGEIFKDYYDKQQRDGNSELRGD